MPIGLLSILNFMLIGLCLGWHTAASAQAENCVKNYFQYPEKRELGIAPSEASDLVRKVAESIGFDGGRITVIPCRTAEKASAWQSMGQSGKTPRGEYIVYDPRWVQEVIGSNRIEAIALFGHELGHFLNRHFDFNQDLSSKEKEKQADRFAGCAVGRMNGQIQSLRELLKRLRDQKSTLYPDRLESLSAAEEGFRACGGGSPQPSNAFKGTVKSFCSDLNLIIASSLNDFISIKQNATIEDVWQTEAKISGFQGCSITKFDTITFNCQGDAQIAKSAEQKWLGQFVKKIQSCLPSPWAESQLLRNTVALRNPGSAISALISTTPIFSSLLGEEPFVRPILQIYKANLKVKKEPAQLTLEAKIPVADCPSIQIALKAAEGNFAELPELARVGDGFQTSSIQIAGWSRCKIAVLDDRTKYVSCALPGNIKEASVARTMAETYSSDLRACLGESWASETRQRTEGRVVVETSSTLSKATVEVRTKEAEGLYSLSLDFNEH